MDARLRSPRTAAALAATVLVAASIIATHAARAHVWVRHAEAPSARLLAHVQPVDRATLLSRAPAFMWPAQGGANEYTIALTFPDGHTESRSTRGNWFAWDRPVPAGRYHWQVMVAGRARMSGDRHWFVVDQAARG